MFTTTRYVYLICSVVLLALSGSALKAQTYPSELWHHGFMVHEDGDTLVGEINYNLETDVLQLRSDHITKTYTARNIVYFQIKDQTINLFRDFYSLPYRLNGGYEALIFFEVLVEGELTLLGRERIVMENVVQPYATGNYTYNRKRLVFDHFLVKNKEEIVEVPRRKKEFFSLLSKYNAQVKSFMKDNRLESDERLDLIRITRFYNDLALGNS